MTKGPTHSICCKRLDGTRCYNLEVFSHDIKYLKREMSMLKLRLHIEFNTYLYLRIQLEFSDLVDEPRTLAA